MIRLFLSVAACCAVTAALVPGAAGAAPPVSGLSDALTANDTIEWIESHHHNCKWEADGMYYYDWLGRRRPCYIQHRSHHDKNAPKTEPKPEPKAEPATGPQTRPATASK